MTDAYLCTVVIPSRNRPEFVASAVTSVFAQTVDDLEVIVVDDGSEPALTPTGPLADPHVRLVRQERSLGVCAARNLGTFLARGSYVAYLDDDDQWAPEKLERQLAAMRASGRRWSSCGVVHVDEHGGEIFPFSARAVGTHPEALIEQENRISTPSTVVAERELLWENGGFSASLSVLADWECWIRLARIAPLEVVDEPLVRYVVHPGSMHRNQIALARRERRVLARVYGGTNGHAIGGASFWFWLARAARDAGDPKKAAGLLAYAVLRFPGATAREARRILARRGIRR